MIKKCAICGENGIRTEMHQVNSAHICDKCVTDLTELMEVSRE